MHLVSTPSDVYSVSCNRICQSENSKLINFHSPIALDLLRSLQQKFQAVVKSHLNLGRDEWLHPARWQIAIVRRSKGLVSMEPCCLGLVTYQNLVPLLSQCNSCRKSSNPSSDYQYSKTILIPIAPVNPTDPVGERWC
jgi:hypothetical protein